MVYLLTSDAEESGFYSEELGVWIPVNNMGSRWSEYKDYLETIKDKLPPDGYLIGSNYWRLGMSSPGNFHDSWVEKVVISEEPTEGRRHRIKAQHRRLDIFVRLLGSYWDRYHELHYFDVQSYALFFGPEDGERTAVPHSDWLIDEVRLSDNGYMIHEVEFRSGARWLIECKDFTYKEKPRNWPREIPLGEQVDRRQRLRPNRPLPKT